MRISRVPTTGTSADEPRSISEAYVARCAADDVALAGGLRGGGCFCGPAVGGTDEIAQLSVGELPISFLTGSSAVRRLTPSAGSLAHAGLATAEAEGLCVGHRATLPGQLLATWEAV